MNLRDLKNLPNEDILRVLNRLEEETGELPSDLKLFYEVLEDARFQKLPPDIKLRLFIKSKEEWCKLYFATKGRLT